MASAGVVGILLGAGASRRLGRPKQTLPFGDTTLLGWVVREAEASSLDRVVVVLGGAAEAVLASLEPRRARIVENKAYGDGCASSLRTGLDAAGACDGVMLLLGDMPGVDAAIIDGVLAQWEARRPWALVTRYDDALGHPLVFSVEALPALRALHGDKAVWKLLERNPERVSTVPVHRPLPGDVDTWADYEKRAGVVR